MQEVHLSSTDANDLLECLDYSRMSTTPRRKSENVSTSQLATLSQLPSPFFEEFVNLLPFSYARPMTHFPENDDIFTNHNMFDSSSAFLPTSMSIPMYNSIPLQTHVPDTNIHPSLPPHSNSMEAPGLPNNQNVNLTHNFSPASSSQSQSYGISPGRRESFPHIATSNVGGDMDFIAMPQLGNMLSRRLTTPATSMKRPWYETSV